MHLLRCPISLSGYNIADFVIYEVDLSWFCCLGGERLPHQELHRSPNPYKQWVGSLTPHRIYICKGCEMGPVVYPPYPRRLESLTVCRCLYKGSTFFSVI